MQSRFSLIFAGLSGLSGIMLGASGAHALRAKLLAAGMTAAWETAVFYQLVHTVALLAATLYAARQPVTPETRWIARAIPCWLIGIALFSGSLYILALGGPRWLGPVTPFGGLAFMLGWACLIPAAAKTERVS